MSPEQKLIRRLKRLARDWPDEFWLFSCSGRLLLMRRDADGERAYLPDSGVDPKYKVCQIDIPNDGGDW